MGKLKELKSGVIIRVKLEHDLGYVYGKVINHSTLLKEKKTVNELVHFYDYITPYHLDKNDLSKI